MFFAVFFRNVISRKMLPILLIQPLSLFHSKTKYIYYFFNIIPFRSHSNKNTSYIKKILKNVEKELLRLLRNSLLKVYIRKLNILIDK